MASTQLQIYVAITVLFGHLVIILYILQWVRGEVEVGIYTALSIEDRGLYIGNALL
jgi:hypothetical protein